jgi:hypothetical protein
MAYVLLPDLRIEAILNNSDSVMQDHRQKCAYHFDDQTATGRD